MQHVTRSVAMFASQGAFPLKRIIVHERCKYTSPDSQIWKIRFWAESVISFRCQKGNKCI